MSCEVSRRGESEATCINFRRESGLHAEAGEDGRGKKQRDGGGGDESSENDYRQGVEQFFARFTTGEDEWNERQGRNERRHEDRDDPVHRCPHNRAFGYVAAFLPNERETTGDEHDAVPRDDTGQRNKAHEMREVENAAREPDPDDAADNDRWDVEHDLKHDGDGLEGVIEDREDQEQPQDEHDRQTLAVFFLALVGPLVGD